VNPRTERGERKGEAQPLRHPQQRLVRRLYGKNRPTEFRVYSTGDWCLVPVWAITPPTAGPPSLFTSSSFPGSFARRNLVCGVPERSACQLPVSVRRFVAVRCPWGPCPCASTLFRSARRARRAPVIASHAYGWRRSRHLLWAGPFTELKFTAPRHRSHRPD
jgi:hypothetical protein